jgi:hypothetical protein
MKKIFSFLILYFLTTTCYAYVIGNLKINNLSSYPLVMNSQSSVYMSQWSLPNTIESIAQSTIPMNLDKFHPNLARATLEA